jgi:CRISPR-associated endonuclease/helicase Cas3
MDGWPTHPWGKFILDAKGQPHWHPLEDHCADVAACLEALLHRPIIRRRVAALAGLPDLSYQQIDRLCVFAFLHDLGKANSGFQSKIFADRRHKAGHVLEVSGLLDPAHARQFQTALSWSEVSRWTGSPLTAQSLLLAAFSHHGAPVLLANRSDESRFRSLWDSGFGLDPLAMVSRLSALARQYFPGAFDSDAGMLPDTPALQHVFAGLVMLADWIGSGINFFPFTNSADRDRMPFARRQAKTAMRQLGIDLSVARLYLENRPLDLAATCGVPALNAMQTAMAEIELLDGPSLLLLESETGSGKTEAALCHFWRLLQTARVEGMYFAVPTRAAATQLHQRIYQATQRLFGAVAPPVLLAVPGYIRVDDAEGELLPDFNVLWNDRVPDAAMRARGWAAENPKRFMAAPIVVGTIDQALLGVLRVDHAHLRAASLLRHLLVVDEVHASDPYMTVLLERLLSIFRQAGGHALLMSATLGAAARAHLLQGAAAIPEPEAAAVEQPYPALTHGRGRHAPAITGINSDRAGKTVTMVTAPSIDDADDIATRALAAARDGARVLVIRNTVAQAVATHEALERLAGTASPLLFRCEKRVTLHHARFARDDRKLLDGAIERAIGKHASNDPVVVIATQTVEQSLDIDADFLITDLCPIDVLLQRLGRLHRHSREGRPPSFAAASCLVLVPATRDLSVYLHRPAHGFGVDRESRPRAYPDLRAAQACWELLKAEPIFRIPAMNRCLVERGLHPERLAEIAAASPDWQVHGQSIDGIRAAQKGTARLNLVDWSVQFCDRENAFGEAGIAIRTRLGLDDRLASLPEAPTGPFGAPLTLLRIPGFLARGITADATPRLVDVGEDRIEFEYGERLFQYDRLGLRVRKGGNAP